MVYTLGEENPKQKDSKVDVVFESVYENTASGIEVHSTADKKVKSEDSGVDVELFETCEKKELAVVSEEETALDLDERRKRLSSLSDNSLFDKMEYSISQLEKQPAYKRAGVNVSFKEIQTFSRNYYSQQNGELSSNNSYLHDNVD